MGVIYEAHGEVTHLEVFEIMWLHLRIEEQERSEL